ncbi:hypothetical protein CK203_002033 [Vitis vinifera]|uniref:Uncharacterized protein n=1 Tax=Vitis vinifera TaxID=29760 RepID=A0A438KK02_VITVI|nr:hypothetical protein CK203_002033 [Vitis vinifera]
MFPPAEDAPDLGIPPNRGPLPVRTNPNSEPNYRVRSGHRRNARPQGIRGARAHRGAIAGVVVSWRVLLFFVLISVVPILDEKCTVGFVVLMIMQNKIGVTEQEWSFLDGIKSGTSLKFG